jgi:hypothetical protein
VRRQSTQHDWHDARAGTTSFQFWAVDAETALDKIRALKPQLLLIDVPLLRSVP